MSRTLRAGFLRGRITIIVVWIGIEPELTKDTQAGERDRRSRRGRDPSPALSDLKAIPDLWGASAYVDIRHSIHIPK
ncbi:hypothetical protein EVAR_23680_1 [Eumeta japonica]|uniref:Uncharacterized protein n=1 Tax=Eumeta variegata TaxID=151549 RepID=A0A4C1VKS7_EUMVA|nr:hypothetical protein EVAR_23680_1 [Eumeta japonica]